MNSTGLFCPNCGELNDALAQFCHKCGVAQPQLSSPVPAPGPGAASPAPALITQASPYSAPPAPPVYGSVPPVFPPPPPAAAGIFRGYAGFWIRVLAILIDGAALSVVIVPIWLVFGGMVAVIGSAASRQRGDDPAAVFAMLPILGLMMLAIFAINWLYEALMTSSSKQATLGKMALRLKVVDKNGDRLSFMHATGRHFAKIVNNLTLYIGWMMAGFTERKQGLHDMIAGTYVIKT